MTASTTLLDTFLKLATSSVSSSWHVVECGKDTLTYGELLGIACGIAEDLSRSFGPEAPTVAIVSENHPYTLAVIISTWLLGGVVAPLDSHAPEVLLRGMLEIVEPTCVVLPTSDVSKSGLLKDMDIPVYAFHPDDSTIPLLIRRFPLETNNVHEASWFTHPTLADSDAVYMFTSSAFSASTLKCVPLTHLSIYTNCIAQLSWLHSTFPATSFDRLRVLGWGPWTHIMGLSHDIGTHCFLTGGCYIFGVVPSTYATHNPPNKQCYADLGDLLLDTAVRCGATAFAGVPWIIRKFMESENRKKADLQDGEDTLASCAMRPFKVLISGGARTDTEVIQWAETTGLHLILGIGMSELGGPMFHSRATSTEQQGWPLSKCLIPDAELLLLDDSGLPGAKEGELVVKSKLISHGYRRFDTNTFSTENSGVITFRTGDIYALENDHIRWKGRREDYIQLLSGEILDPRIPESQLDSNPSIARSCLVGDTWTGTAKSICAIIELTPSNTPFAPGDIIQAMAAVNRTLAPPLRIAWSRVLVLGRETHIPMTRKGVIWRKALEQHFGAQLKALLEDPKLSRLNETALPKWTTQEVESAVADIVAEVLGVSKSLMEQHAQSTFAELGMDSQMAMRIVNALNPRFELRLPLNTCHDHIDLSQLSRAVSQKLGLVEASASLLPATINPTNGSDEVVIIGHALRLPGGINTAEAFWEALTTRRQDIIGPIPADRWDHASFYNPTGTGVPGSISFDRSGFIDVASYDNAFFGISSAEAYFITPAARLTLEASVEALENANVPLSSVKGTNMGVFVATAPDDGYVQLLWVDRGYGAYTRHHGSGVAASAICGRLSYFLDVHGPSICLDTACSAGMVALDNAVQHIKRGDGETAIVCSVNTHLWPGIFSFLSENKMTSPRGRCATFSADADGYAPSEGVVSLVLKSKSAAIRDNDNILGVIRSTAVQHNGRSQGLIAPNAQAQANLQRTLLSKANLHPNHIDFLETHGTGTTLGDLLEIQAINDVFSGSHSQDTPLVLGASKTVIGHTEASAGLVGVLATLISLRKGFVPGLAHLNHDNLNPNIDTSLCPLVIPYSNISLPRRESVAMKIPLRGLNLAYGFAGTISGVVLEEHVTQPRGLVNGSTDGPQTKTVCNSCLFVLSAKTHKALMDYMHHYIDFCSRASKEDLPNICYTSCVGREHHRYRFSCVVHTLSELINRLQAALADAASSPFQPVNPRPRLILGFPGQGSQYQGMARDLCLHNSTFDILLRKRATDANHLLGIDILPFLLEEGLPDASETINQTHIAQACIYVYQCAVTEWLWSVGIRPYGVLPHSLGEIAASVAAGAMSFRTGLEFIVTRSMSMRPDPARPGAMAAISASVKVVADAIQASDLQSHVTIAAFNSSNHYVISGDEWAIDTLLCVLSPTARCTKLAVNQGFHSHCIDGSLDSIRQWLEAQGSALHAPALPFYSSALGDRLEADEEMGTEYWVKQAREPIRFTAAAAKVAQDGATLILDIGPRPVLAGLLPDIPACNSIITASLTPKRGKAPEDALLSALAVLFDHGVAPDFPTFFAGRHQILKKISLPTYPWQRQRHYPGTIPSRNTSTSKEGKRLSEFWDVDDDLVELLADHSSDFSPVVPTAAMAILVAQSARGKHLPGIPDIDMRILKPLVLDGTASNQVTVEITDKDSKYSISHRRESTPADIVCTGKISQVEHLLPKDTTDLPGSLPESILTRSDIYARLEGGRVAFGPKFQNLTEIRLWANRADGTVHVEPTGNARCDLIRQLDPCLHMFGALSHRTHPASDGPGSFLPSALTGFRLVARSLPNTFICRYHLPIKIERNFGKMTASFEVFSQSEELLASCEAYSVAWIPANVPFAPKIDLHPRSLRPSLLRTVWSQVPRLEARPAPDWYRIVYLGCNPGLLEALKSGALAQGHSFLASNHLPARGDTLDVVVYDATLQGGLEICTDRVTTYSNDALEFMKAVSTGIRSRHIAAVIFLTRNSFIILPDETDKILHLSTQPHTATSLELAGSMVQGMLRVLRHECDAQNVWGLDIPPMSFNGIAELLFEEIRGSVRRFCSPVAYRYSSGGSLLRLVPSLRRESGVVIQGSRSMITGSVVIIGLGDIGRSMAGRFIEAGCTGIVFIGRRRECDAEILSALQKLRGAYHDIPLSYYSADVTSFSSLSDALKAAISDETFGPIQTVVHTASVVKDSLINNTTSTAFQDVIAPKVWGAWNLHRACHELKLEIQRFIVLSSISVPLGNPGQIAYVAANSFLDTLAAHRTLTSPSTRSISLQLGAWESRLIEGMEFVDGPMEPISHAEGLPLLLKAVEGKRSVQVLAKLRPERMAKMAVYAEDPYFQEYLDINNTAEIRLATGATREDVEEALTAMLKDILEMAPDEQLDLSGSLASFGLDSIAFTQLRGGVMKKFGVSIPMSFLGEECVAKDIVDYVVTS